MASDSQILALSTMFTEDVFAFYGGKARFGEAVQVATGRTFVVIITVVAYVIALRVPQSIFDVATQYAFAGYSALTPLLVGALFWRREHAAGARSRARCGWRLPFSVWPSSSRRFRRRPRAWRCPCGPSFGTEIITRSAAGTMVLGMLPVVPMTLVSAALMVVVSLLTPSARPSAPTLARYFAARVRKRPWQPTETGRCGPRLAPRPIRDSQRPEALQLSWPSQFPAPDVSAGLLTSPTVELMST